MPFRIRISFVRDRRIYPNSRGLGFSHSPRHRDRRIGPGVSPIRISCFIFLSLFRDKFFSKQGYLGENLELQPLVGPCSRLCCLQRGILGWRWRLWTVQLQTRPLCTCLAHLSRNALPKVVEDYTDEIEVAEMTGGQAAADQALESRRKRQRAWADRSADSNPSEWRALKRPRVATYNFIRYLDNQVTCLRSLGLCYRLLNLESECCGLYTRDPCKQGWGC